MLPLLPECLHEDTHRQTVVGAWRRLNPIRRDRAWLDRRPGPQSQSREGKGHHLLKGILVSHSLRQPSHQFPVLTENVSDVTVETRKILALGHAGMQIQNVCRECEIQLCRFSLKLTAKLRSCLKLDSFAAGHLFHYRQNSSLDKAQPTKPK
jgi:hypothetical protein